ncbi:MAG: M48 family metallopeptidase [Pseudomonadales bacterium]|nr:M48 family metallopeptidase [Pseudomonadales bacterium]
MPLVTNSEALSAIAALDFDVRVIKCKRKTLSLTVKEQFVEVRSPYWLRDQEIEQFVLDKADWCRLRLQEAAARHGEKPDFSHESQCLFFGTPRTILHHSGKPQVIERENILHVFHYATSAHQPTKHAAYLAKWMKQEAERYLSARTLELEQQLCPPKPVTAVQFRKTKSKWGHCSSKGEIQLNWLLIMAPPEVMDYVIIHELCHLTYMNHSKTYWQLVHSYCPDYQHHIDWLNQYGHKISIIS